MSRYSQSPQIAVPRLTLVVKVFLAIATAVFLAGLTGYPFAATLGFVPARFLQGWIWQPFTYPFVHTGIFHLLFNGLVIWTVGSELEELWGRRTFIGFLAVCSCGAAIFYLLFSLFGIGPGPTFPVVGSSGIVYGLLLAYGILFGDRVMMFFMLFPMPARYFVMILGAVELVSSISSSGDGVAHLAHLGGMVFAFFFLVGMAAWRKRLRGGNTASQEARTRAKKLKKAQHLKLVREEEEGPGPKHWN